MACQHHTSILALRLLTLDQLGRAATLICALEHLRQAAPDKLGDVRFSVGLVRVERHEEQPRGIPVVFVDEQIYRSSPGPSLLGAGQKEFDPKGPEDQPADAYMTLAG
jgi:hypothetical protein